MSMNPTSGFSPTGGRTSPGISSPNRTLRSRDAEIARPAEPEWWRMALLIANSYSYATEEERNRILANALGSHFTGHA